MKFHTGRINFIYLFTTKYTGRIKAGNVRVIDIEIYFLKKVL